MPIRRQITSRLLDKISWELRETSNRKKYGPEYNIRPFPQPKVSDFLVSRWFFLSAAKAFIGNQVIVDPSREHRGPQRRYNIILEFVTEAVIHFYAVRYLFTSHKVGPNLKILTIKSSDHELEIVKTKYLWEEPFDEHDFQLIAEQASLEHLGRLREYHFIFNPSSHVRSQAQHDVWSLNMCKFEEYVRAYARNANVCMDQKGVNMFSSSIFSRRGIKSSPKTIKADKSSEKVPGSEMKLDQLPETAKEMIALLKKDGENVMRLMARLKAERREGQKDGSIST